MIYVTGDIHGNPVRLSNKIFPEGKEMTKDEYVIICGEFGFVWVLIESKPWTTLFIPGNHENYDRLYGVDDPALLKCWLYDSLTEEQKDRLYTGYPEKKWHGGVVRELRPSVLMLDRGYVFNIDGKKCFTFGGASSHDISDGILHPEYLESNSEMHRLYRQWSKEDKLFRVNHMSWWREELPTETEMQQGIESLEANNWHVDFVFTHCAPSSVLALLSRGTYKPDDLTGYLEMIRQKLDYTKWFFGHYHDNINVTNKDLCIYEQIVRVS